MLRMSSQFPLFSQTIGDLLNRAQTVYGAREALVDHKRRYTFNQLVEAVRSAEASLDELGIRPGDRVAVSMANSAEIVILFLATLERGAIWVGVNRLLAPPEKQFILRDAGASLFVGDADMVSQLAALSPMPR